VQDALNGKDLLPDQGSLEASSNNQHGRSWVVSAEASPREATCPDCGPNLEVVSPAPASNLRSLRDEMAQSERRSAYQSAGAPYMII
jgi:hypothetical protein